MTLVTEYEENEMGMTEIFEDLQEKGFSPDQIALVIECCDWL